MSALLASIWIDLLNIASKVSKLVLLRYSIEILYYSKMF